MAIERLRDEKTGRFIKASEAAAKAHRATEKATGAYSKQFATISKTMAAMSKHQKAQVKWYAKTEKQIVKLAKAQQKLAKSMKQTQNSSRGGSGLKMAIPGILAPAMILASAKAMSSYVTQLARARDMGIGHERWPSNGAESA